MHLRVAVLLLSTCLTLSLFKISGRYLVNCKVVSCETYNACKTIPLLLLLRHSCYHCCHHHHCTIFSPQLLLILANVVASAPIFTTNTPTTTTTSTTMGYKNILQLHSLILIMQLSLLHRNYYTTLHCTTFSTVIHINKKLFV